MKTLMEFKVEKVRKVLGQDVSLDKLEAVVEALEWANIEYDELCHELELFYAMEATYQEQG